MKINYPLPIAIAVASALSFNHSVSASEFFGDATFDVKWKVNYYDIKGDVEAKNVPVNLAELGSIDYPTTADVNYDMSIKDAGTSAWLRWQSGWIANTVGVELEYQGAFIFDQSGRLEGETTAATPMGPMSLTITSDNPYYYGQNADETHVGKLGNANLRLKFGGDDQQVQVMFGRFTPSIYDLLHRPDEIYYGMHQVYEGINIEGHYAWASGMIDPWLRYMTGYSNEWNTGTVRFNDDIDDLYYDENNMLQDGFDEIINVGFHTETEVLTASASYSYAADYLSNGIIEVYSGIPYSYIGLGDVSEDADHYLKYMLKYGFEKGLGDNNEDHKTDVYEFAIGLQHGNLDFLAGVTQNGDESFYGFETGDGMNAGGGTAVWGDVAILNTFKLAGQRTYFLVGGLDLDGLDLAGWRIQGVIANANDTDLAALRVADRVATPNEDYTEANLDIIYAKNGYQGEGMSYVLKFGKDDNYNAFGFGAFIEYNGDVTNMFD